MLEAGYIQDASEAFTTDYIENGGRAYDERFKLSPEEGIRHIMQTGGVAVLAHPGYLSDRSTLEEEEILRYKAGGLHGLEVFYSMHTPEQTEYYRGIAERNGLLITGGSDCHGTPEPLIGRVRLPYRYLDRIKKLSADRCG